MTTWDRLDGEQEAVQSLMALYEQAKKCQQLYERAEMALPEALKRFLGMNGTGNREVNTAHQATSHILAPEGPKPPKEAASDWISIDVREALTTTVALAVLRAAGEEPVRARDLTAGVTQFLPNVTGGTLANAGTRLVVDATIERTNDGWKLLKQGNAGVIQNGRLWGPKSIFGKPELAAHRREAILHVLRQFPTGLQTVQIVEQLRNCHWVHAPINKDLLKLDMETLRQSEKVRRRGNTKKWEIAPAEKGK